MDVFGPTWLEVIRRLYETRLLGEFAFLVRCVLLLSFDDAQEPARRRSLRRLVGSWQRAHFTRRLFPLRPKARCRVDRRNGHDRLRASASCCSRRLTGNARLYGRPINESGKIEARTANRRTIFPPKKRERRCLSRRIQPARFRMTI